MSSFVKLLPASTPPIVGHHHSSPSASLSNNSADYFFSKILPASTDHTPTSSVLLSPPGPTTQLSPNTISQSAASSAVSDRSTGSADNSAGSSDYLTPPERQDEHEIRPYKPRRNSSASLTLLWNRVRSLSRKKQRRARRTRSHKGRYPLELTLNEAQHHAYWWLPRTAGRSSQAHRFMITGNGSRLFSPGSSRIVRPGSRLMSLPAPPITSRRWSSTASGPGAVLPDQSLRNEKGTNPRRHRRRHRNRTWTKGDREIIQAVRNRLTCHTVTRNEISVPLTITLRRPSTSDYSGSQAGSSTITSYSTGNNHDNQSSQTKEKPTYLITDEDIDSVAELIMMTLKARGVRRNNDATKQYPPQKKALIDLRKPSITSRGLLPGLGRPADAALNGDEVHGETEIPEHPDIIEQTALISQRLPSTHEIIWANTGVSTSSSSSLQTNATDGDPGSGTKVDKSNSGFDTKPQAGGSFNTTAGSGKLFDRHIRWSEDVVLDVNLPAVPERVVSPSSEVPPALNEPIVQPETPSDVVSFPPLLPRKLTKDWISPLPDLSATVDRKNGTEETKIMDEPPPGPDITRAEKPAGLAVEDTSSNLHYGEASPVLRGILWGDDEVGPPRRKSIHLPSRSEARPHADDTDKWGSAIGSSTGERRKSSFHPPHPRVVRIKTHSATRREKKKSWKKPRKDSGWPDPVSPSPEEDDEEQEGETSSEEEELDLVPSKGASSRPQNVLEDDEDVEEHQLIDCPLTDEGDNNVGYKVYNVLYGAFTGSKRRSTVAEKAGEVENAGSEGKAHSSRGPSVDWIG